MKTSFIGQAGGLSVIGFVRRSVVFGMSKMRITFVISLSPAKVDVH